MINYKTKGDNSPDIIDVVLNNRGLTREQVQEIINPGIDLYNPSLMKNIDKATNLLKQSIDNNIKIGIVCDPDVDGYSSSSSLYDLITEEMQYKNVDIIFHTQRVKSHGVDKEIVKYVKDNNIELLILPDAGSTLEDYNRIKQLENNKLNVLILDHHDIEYNPLEEWICVVNPRQEGCDYPNKHLSGAGVTYKFIQAYCNENNITIDNKYIDVVALSLISDMCDMKNSLENRKIFNIGSLQENITSPILKEFISSKNLTGDKISIEEYAFQISSLINATIRIGKQEEKKMLFESFYHVKLVPSNKRGNFGSLEMIQNETLRILGNNKSKQDKEVKASVVDVNKIIDDNGLLDNKVLIMDIGDVSKSSTTGLLANKIMNDERVNRPVLFYRDKKNTDFVGGSGRGIGVESFKDICEETGLLTYSSGHPNAFGWEIHRDKLNILSETLNEKLKDTTFETLLEVDAAYNISIDNGDIKAISDLNELWCNDIKEPIFIVKNIEIDTSKILKIGNATYSFKVDKTTYTKNFCSRVFIEKFAHQEMVDKKARFPFLSKIIIADLVVKFRKNKQGYYYAEIVDAVSKEKEYEYIF